MDNFKIKKEGTTLCIKKGNISKKKIIGYGCISIALFLLVGIAPVEKASKVLYAIYVLFYFQFIVFFTVVFVALSTINFYKNFYLEILNIDNCSKKIKITGPELNVEIPVKDLKDIEILLKKDISYFRGKFEEWCTLAFVTQKGEKHMWGFQLSEKQGYKLKKKIEKFISESAKEEK